MATPHSRDDRHLDKAVERIRSALWSLRSRSDEVAINVTAELLAALEDIKLYRGGRRSGGIPRINHNPPGQAEIMFGQHVLAVEYIHNNGGHYRHEFGRGVRLFANPDGTLALEHVP